MRKIALAAVLCYALLVLTGAAVRLTGSGLGCSDWPSCYAHRLTAEVFFHPLVEFTNRLITILVTVVSGLAWLATLLRSPRRRDLCWLAGGLVAGVVIQIPLGGLVVLTKLNPYLVACHFLITIAILAIAVAFFHAAGIDASHDETRVVPLVGNDLRMLARILLAALGVVTCVGTLVAGAGPHAGAPETAQQPIQRIPIAFRDIAALHSDAALFLIGLSLASLFAFRRGAVPALVYSRLRLLFEMLVIQGALGYLQYSLHDSAVVIEVHMLGVTCLWITAVAFYLSLHEHPESVEEPVGDEPVPAADPLPRRNVVTTG
ncbi:MAG: COX15/CtaA family protein [Acidimicrobiales bacterium]